MWHAAVFGMADVAQVLLAAGATDLVQAAAAGDITALLTAETPQHERVAALRMAAEHGRLDVIDQLRAPRHRWTESMLTGRRPCTRPRAAGGPTASGISLPTARIQAGAIPDSAAHHWAGAATGATETGPGHGHEEVEQLLAQRAPPGIPWPQNIVAVSGGVVRDSRGAAPCVQTTVIHRHAGRATAGREA